MMFAPPRTGLAPIGVHRVALVSFLLRRRRWKNADLAPDGKRQRQVIFLENSSGELRRKVPPEK
jgi:hypothetical protein